MSMNLEQTVQQDFTDFAAFVAQRRAVPDARDMFKYTARQILHAQQKDKLTHAHPFKKSQKSVAAATSFSYVHGDSSAYQQIIHMGRDLVQRYKFEEINGNGGTPIQSDGYAASRYTEARTSELTDDIFKYLGSGLERSDWAPTYDEEGEFPLVLPSVGYYNICNGSFGSIGVGLISSVPQFNLKEVNNAIIHLIDDRNCDVSILPDFASGGILLNPKSTENSIRNGEGKSAILRGKVKISKDYLDIVELPYGVYTETICKEIGAAMEDGNCPITEFKDLSRETVHIRVWSKDIKEAEKWLYKNTSTQKHFVIKMIMLHEGKRPKLFSLREALLAHIEHAKKVLKKECEFQLNQLQLREEILKGLLLAYSIIDSVIKTIKESNGRQDAIRQLVNGISDGVTGDKVNFTLRQAEAIVDLRLHRLSSLDITKLRDELNSNLIEQDRYKTLIQMKEEFYTLLKLHYSNVAKKYGDARKTEIFKGDEYESFDNETPTKEFWLAWNGEEYIADYNDDMEELATNKHNLEDDVIILTSHARGFKVKAKKFKLGRYPWTSMFKFHEGEFVLLADCDTQYNKFNFIKYKNAEGYWKEIHTSFLLNRASARGRQITDKKTEMIDAILIKEKNQ